MSWSEERVNSVGGVEGRGGVGKIAGGEGVEEGNVGE